MDHDVVESTEAVEPRSSNQNTLVNGLWNAEYDSASPRSGLEESRSPDVLGQPSNALRTSIPPRLGFRSSESRSPSLRSRRLPQDVAIMPPQIPKFAPLPHATGRSGFIYDTQMKNHEEPPSEHEPHPEKPERITQIYKELRAADLIPDLEDRNAISSEFHMVRIAARLAEKDELALVHSLAHIQSVQDTRGRITSVHQH